MVELVTLEDEADPSLIIPPATPEDEEMLSGEGPTPVKEEAAEGGLARHGGNEEEIAPVKEEVTPPAAGTQARAGYDENLGTPVCPKTTMDLHRVRRTAIEDNGTGHQNPTPDLPTDTGINDGEGSKATADENPAPSTTPDCGPSEPKTKRPTTCKPKNPPGCGGKKGGQKKSKTSSGKGSKGCSKPKPKKKSGSGSCSKSGKKPKKAASKSKSKSGSCSKSAKTPKKAASKSKSRSGSCSKSAKKPKKAASKSKSKSKGGKTCGKKAGRAAAKPRKRKTSASSSKSKSGCSKSSKKSLPRKRKPKKSGGSKGCGKKGSSGAAKRKRRASSSSSSKSKSASKSKRKSGGGKGCGKKGGPPKPKRKRASSGTSKRKSGGGKGCGKKGSGSTSKPKKRKASPSAGSCSPKPKPAKKPCNGFFVFLSDFRKNRPAGEAVTKTCSEAGAAWRKMSDKETAKYKKSASDAAATKRIQKRKLAKRNKKPCTGFFAFLREFRKNRPAGEAVTKTSSEAGAAWRKMSDKEKAKYKKPQKK